MALVNRLSTLLALAALVVPAAAPAQQAPTISEVLSGVVGLHATIPDAARTAGALGTEREGHGVVIDSDGLVLTIGYLILEADSVVLTTASGRTVSATIVAYDHNSGFGLVRADAKLDARPVPMADSTRSAPGDEVIVAGSGGPTQLMAARIISRRTFAGYWEYLLEDAIFTIPPYPSYGGAALFDKRGNLLAVGSLLVQDAAESGLYSPGNMFVPVEALKPVLADLMTGGRPATPPHPWLGLFTTPAERGLAVVRVSPDGPAESAGIVPGSVIVGVEGAPVADQEDFYRRVWARGAPGVTVRLTLIEPDGEAREVAIVSGDRYDWLRLRKGGE